MKKNKFISIAFAMLMTLSGNVFMSCEEEEEKSSFYTECIHCEGTGNCWLCDGYGYITGFDKNYDCTSCNGKGTCKYCNGKGYVQVNIKY